MEKKEDIKLDIAKEDINSVKEYLKGKTEPVEFEDVVYHVALFKTQEKRKSLVKIYNPNCEFKSGDFIYKEYPGNLPIGGKKIITIETPFLYLSLGSMNYL